MFIAMKASLSGGIAANNRRVMHARFLGINQPVDECDAAPESEPEFDVNTRRPTVDIGTPDVRGTHPDPVELPQLIAVVQNQATVKLVEVLHAEAALEIAEQIRATEVSACFQLVSGDPQPERQVQVHFVGHESRASTDLDMGARPVESFKSGGKFGGFRGRRGTKAAFISTSC
jgi:hypothetical protein